MSPRIERLDAIERFGIGEGPHWEPSQQALYLVDLTTGTIACWWPKSNKTIYQNVGAHASFIIPVKGKSDEFVVGSSLELLHIKWDTAANKLLKKDVLVKITGTRANKINDAKCDSKGRLWFGTWNDDVSSPDGSFYSFTRKEGLVKRESSIYISNGIGFTPDNKKMYYIDTVKFRVDQYRVDGQKGSCEFEKTAFDFKTAGISGAPDGMTVDADGNLWIACVFGSQVIQVNPSGKVLQSVQFPGCSQITSATFGGSQWDELFVTSANITQFSGELKHFASTAGAPEAGATYCVRDLGAKGVPPFEFDMDL